MTLPQEIDVMHLKRMRDDGSEFVLLDVREDDELAIARLAWAKHVPMATVPQRLDEFAKDDAIVVMCHGGTRSGKVARFLREQGFQNVANLSGGIDAWSEQVDPGVPTY